ncbi:MAG TPA: chromate transporter [Stellaceae bacterium]|nr:chromate transporter [Stellaceae bacterium]
MKASSAWLLITAQFALLSLLSFGGINTVLPEVHRFVVDVHGWLSDSEFADLFAIAQAAPGPNFLIASLIGWQVAGLLGAVGAALGICGPPCILTFFMARLWQRFHGSMWRRALQDGLAPLTVGLVLATGYVLSRAAIHGWVTGAITAATVALTLATRVHPLWLFAVAGVLGIFGLA